MSDLCLECREVVRPRQHGVSCDVCDLWQHRTCNTGISVGDYHKARKRLIVLKFTCRTCSPSDRSSASLSVPNDVDDEEPPVLELSVHGMNVTSASLAASDDVDDMEPPVLELSVPVAPRSPDMNVTYVIAEWEPAADSTKVDYMDVTTPDTEVCSRFSIDVSGNSFDDTTANPEVTAFDVTRNVHGDLSVRMERSLDEPQLSQTVVQDPGEVTYEVITEGTERKRMKLVSSDGFAYIKKKETKRSVQWRCCVRRKHNLCYANVTQHGDVFSRGPALHSHGADALMKKKVVLKRDIRREAVRDVHAPAGRVVDDRMVSTFDGGDFNLPKPSNLVRQLNRARQKIRPKDPTSLDFEFNTEYIQDDFLVGDVIVGDERHLIFATVDQLYLLQRARTWYLDGTFSVVSKPFSQLWSIHGFIRQGESMKQVPLMFVMMSRRRKQDYISVLRKITDILDVAPVVEGFVMDFEVGLWQALREVFPGCSLRGCGFHWAQAVLRKVQEVGLQSTYQEREGPHLLVRKLLAIPFLPPGDIKRAFRKLRDRAETGCEPLQQLFQYVSDQWVESSLWSTEEWSVYRQPVRTNNDTEGWHRRLNGKAGRGSLQFYVLVSLLLQEAKLVTLTMQLVSESAVGRNRRQAYRDLDGRLHELWTKYEEHDIVCEQFLSEVGSVYST